MSFLDTEPAAIDSVEFAGPWSPFRVADPRQRLGTLRALCRTDVPISLGAPGSPLLCVNLWAIDDLRARLHLKVVAGADRAELLCAHPRLWAAAYLDLAKVQFDVCRPMLEGSPGQRTLTADAPGEMYRLPRRRAVRVRRAEGRAPWLRFAHAGPTGRPLALRVLDISTSGCALWKAAGEMPLAPGAYVRAVEVELEPGVFIFSDLCVRHVSLDSRLADQPGARVGCSWEGLAPAAQDTLQRWIRRGQRRRDLISLSLD